MSTSSCEAEVYAQVSLAAEGINLRRALELVMGDPVLLDLMCDASAARAACARQGVGCMKHLAVQGLWIQGAIKQGLLTMRSVGTRHNLMDMQTKALDRNRLELKNMSGIHAVPSHTLTGVIKASA